MKAAKPIPSARELEPHHDVLARGGIVHQVLSEIPAKARKTVHGRATVVIRIAVDSSGNVTDAKLERGSRYFGKLALAAARSWRFTPIEGVSRREWVLRFEITKTAINVIPEERSALK